MKRENLNFFLQQADPDDIYALCQQIKCMAEVQIIQQATPQTLLVPVDDPVNHGSFYGGEVLVSSAIVRVNETDGWAMVIDENPDLALNLAILDGACAAGVEKKLIQALARQGEERHKTAISNMEKQVAATRVSFDLM